MGSRLSPVGVGTNYGHSHSTFLSHPLGVIHNISLFNTSLLLLEFQTLYSLLKILINLFLYFSENDEDVGMGEVDDRVRQYFILLILTLWFVLADFRNKRKRLSVTCFFNVQKARKIHVERELSRPQACFRIDLRLCNGNELSLDFKYLDLNGLDWAMGQEGGFS